LSPTPAGSITISSGPIILFVLIPIPSVPPMLTVDVCLLKVRFAEAPATPSSLKMI
jgi:hypothetical protein